MENDYIAHSSANEDDHFAEYAEEVMRYAKEKQWPIIPIKKVIEVRIYFGTIIDNNVVKLNCYNIWFLTQVPMDSNEVNIITELQETSPTVSDRKNQKVIKYGFSSLL